jgi:hypothetical protein
VVETTNKKQALTWSRFKAYLNLISIIGNDYMDNFNRHQKHKILSAFCNAIREGRLLSNQNKSNKAGSVGSALDHVAQTYKLANRLDPRMATNGKFAFIIQC